MPKKAAAMRAPKALESGRRAGADNAACRTAYIAKPVRQPAIEQIPFTSLKYLDLFSHCDFYLAFGDDPGFLARVGQ